MYDTLHIWLPADRTCKNDLLQASKYLTNLTEHKSDEKIYMSGKLNNFKVNLSESGASFKGSLAKYFLSDNFSTLTRSDTARAIEQMANEIHLPVALSKVSRIDFAQNLLMDYEPEAYYNYLGQSNHYKRVKYDKSVAYTNGRRRYKTFYNKIAEGRAKKMIIPDVWKSQNVLRYELRYTSRLPKEFNVAEVTASSLANEKFYMELCDRWYSEYEAINKINSINLNLNEMKSEKDFYKQLELFAIHTIGQDKLMEAIEEMRIRKVFPHPEYYSRLKSGVKKLCETPKLTASSELVIELDKKIKDAKRYYR